MIADSDRTVRKGGVFSQANLSSEPMQLIMPRDVRLCQQSRPEFNRAMADVHSPTFIMK